MPADACSILPPAAGSPASKLKPPSLAAVPGATAPFSVGLSPQAQAEREVWLAEERTRAAAFQSAEAARIRRHVEDQLHGELNDVLAQHSFSWRRLLCCCCPPQQAVSVCVPRPATAPARINIGS
jgi:hypothetical protein